MLNMLNKMLNPFSMYKGMSFGLTAVWAAAFVFSFFGIISFTPLEMLASTTVFGLSVYGGSLLFGLIFGVRIHGESSYITALILALIFSPTLEFRELSIFALVGVIAAASKFVLTYRRRHVYNPAAVAAFIIGVTGLGFASWWVATPPLLPFVLILALISLYKTRRLDVAGIFLGISVPLLLLTFMLEGSSFLESAQLLLSWPLIFFAGVMLTEPLTLPPRKWQQYVEAAIVAVLFSLPLDLGIVEMNPALALLIGNAIAFGFAQRQRIALKFKERTALTPTTDEFRFTPLKPVHYEAGQYAEITVHHPRKDLRGIRRSFSLTSAPGSDEVTFGIKFYEPSSTFKTALRKIKKGMVIEATMVGGDFVLPKDPSTPILYVAGGIGVTPFISHLQYLRSQSQKRDITLVYAVSNRQEIAYRTLLEDMGVKVVIVTTDTKGALPKSWRHDSAPYVSKELLSEYVPDIAERIAYVSGPPALVDAVKRSLRQLGAKKTKTDYFVGY